MSVAIAQVDDELELIIIVRVNDEWQKKLSSMSKAQATSTEFCSLHFVVVCAGKSCFSFRVGCWANRYGQHRISAAKTQANCSADLK
jgi:hypothetical protein